MTSNLLHAYDTPLRVLDRSSRDKSLGKGMKKVRMWTYVRDQRAWIGTSPPGALYDVERQISGKGDLAEAFRYSLTSGRRH